MKLILALVVLVPAVALGQGLNKYAPGQKTSAPRTNYLLQSNSASSSTSPVSPWAVASTTLATIAGAPVSAGGGTWAEATTTATNGRFYQTITVPSSTKVLLSVYAAKSSGTGATSLIIGGASCARTACWCSRSGAGTCSTSTVASDYCKVLVGDLTTTEERISAGITCGAAVTSAYVELAGGDTGVATGTTRFTGIMIEAGKTAAPAKICVTTTAAATCK